MIIKFFDESHSYFDENGIQYTSVSSLVKKVEPIKDWAEITRKYALKVGKTVEQVKAEWDAEKLRGTTIGTKVHAHFEEKDVSVDFVGNLKVIRPVIENGVKISSSNILQPDSLYPELMLYSHEHRVAGQSDRVIVEGNYVDVTDYKTDKSIDFLGYVSDYKPGFTEKLTLPVPHIQNVNGWVYCLKMSIYMRLILMSNPQLQCRSIRLDHVRLKRDADMKVILDNDGNPTILGIVPFELPYLEQEAIDLLNLNKTDYGK